MDHDLWSNSRRRYATDYEVFLNFRGKDIRGGLIDILRYFMKAAGIRCFFDDDSLHTGDVIDEQLLRGIERSHVYIVMLSQNYAESKSCLMELAHMVKCQAVSNGRKVILPMFCDVTVENVKLKEGSSYRAALENLSIAEEDRQEWTDALIKVGHIKGLHKVNIGDVDFSQMIIKDVRFRLRMRYLSYHLVGMDERAKSVEKLLDVESGDVRFLVIHGEGGTGKTTLARALFLQHSTRFQGSSFIADIGEIWTHHGFLERKLLSDICGDELPKRRKNVCGDYGESRSVKESFRDKKVLIVLDGVDEWQQIKKVAGRSTWFGSGSRIIITTSNRKVLSIPHEVSEERNLNQAREVFGFEMKEMESKQAVQVFSRELGRDIVRNNYWDPLWKHSRVWKHEEALNVLKIKEENNLRVIDLKCCGILTKTPRLSQFENLERLILEDCTGLTEIDHSIGELRGLKCLNIKGCDSLKTLPDQICSLEMLTEILITKKVCRSFSLPKSIGLLKSLTTLEIVRVKMARIPKSIGSLENLQRLSLLGCSDFKKLPESFGQLKSLVELDISETKVIRLPKSIKELKKLKVIKMEHSSIKKLPLTIGKVKKLEELHAKHSRDLQGKVPHGIRKLCHLKILDLSHTSLGRLPENLSALKHLQKLQIQSCCDPRNLSQLPPKLTDLGITFWALCRVSNLSELGSTLSHLVINTEQNNPPIERHNWEFDFRGLTKLEKLELHVPNVPNLRPEFKFPDTLNSLHLSCQDLHRFSELPSSLSKLTLTNDVVKTRLPNLDNLERLSSLELLNCKLIDDRGPIEIGRLATLVHLSASRCLFRIANGLRPPKTLRVLNVIECEFRNTILHLSGLKCLKRLEISYCKGLVEVKGLGELELLEELIILECPSLVRLEGDISNSKGLKVFRLIDNHELREIEGLERVSARNLKCFNATGRNMPSPNISRRKRSRYECFD
ncbi:hypothetical protein CRG98_042844 [Punica granatum]|uniref:TIR domain-containing protein n=1 Tax=Punica granatum TaxID=22663 RepID=A0A2I0HYK2_PUNGR|nr:hypothetical protein CRG98_042844 [Punica granatum]